MQFCLDAAAAAAAVVVAVAVCNTLSCNNAINMNAL